MGRVAAVKMKVLPQVLLFSIIHISSARLNNIQAEINKCITLNKGQRINSSVLQQTTSQGGLTFPNLPNTTLLEALMEWWLPVADKVNNLAEQFKVGIPLHDWMMLGRKECSDAYKHTGGIWICKTLMKVWNKLQGKVSTSISPLVLFLYHPKFKVARQIGSFGNWEKTGLSRFHELEMPAGIYSESKVLAKLGDYAGGLFQNRQERGLINSLSRHKQIFWILCWLLSSV